MIIEILINEGGILKPITVEATQVVVKTGNGNPVFVMGKYGPETGYTIAYVKDDDFNKTLRQLGITTTVRCDVLRLPAIPGSKLING